MRRPCARYYEAQHEVLQRPEIRQTLKENQQLFDELTAHTNLSITSFDDVQSLYSTLLAEADFGLDLPKWTRDYFPHRLINLTEASYIINVYTPELQKFKGGPFIRKMLAEQELKAADKLSPSERKLFMYTGHDSTIVNILAALNVWEPQFPAYGITAIFELARNIATDVVGVRIYLRDASVRDEALPLTMPGCDHFCPLSQFKDLVGHLLTGNVEEDCRSKNVDFSTPPPPAP